MAERRNREDKFPAAARAMVGFVTVLRLPDRNRPSPPGSTWPDYAPEDDSHLRSPTGYFETDATKSARPSPKEIDRCLEWLDPCRFMWGNSSDDRRWRMFGQYCLGWSFPKIVDAMDRVISKQRAAQIMDEIFRDIQGQHDDDKRRSETQNEKGISKPKTKILDFEGIDSKDCLSAAREAMAQDRESSSFISPSYHTDFFAKVAESE